MDDQTTQSHGSADPPAPRTQITSVIRGLRAVREFADTPIPPESVERWLDAARWCGSSRNSQPWRFVVVRDESSRRYLSELGDFAGHLRDAPVAIVIAAEEGPFPFSTVFDLGRVSQSLMLAAADEGVGSCIAVFEPVDNIEKARAHLGVPNGMRVDLAVGFGYPRRGSTPDRASAPSPVGRLALPEVAFDEQFGTPLRPSDR